jgi:uncharacterized repeat protein (TIGR01451 family)
MYFQPHSKGRVGAVGTALAAVMGVALWSQADAAAPNAGAIIGNQASATYTDGSGQSRTATSNLVQTIVAQVGGVDIEADQSRTVTIGGTVYFPHTVTNTGNGADTYNLASAEGAGDFDFTNLLVYPDVDQNGVPDSLTPITVTPTLNPGDVYGVVVAGTVPGTATGGQSETIDITATSTFDGGQTDSNTDTVTVTANAVIDVTKAIDITAGPSPNAGPITVTLTYTNRGAATATAVNLEDALPTGMSYIAGTGRWSGSGAIALGDGAGGGDDPAGIVYDGEATTAGTIEATILSVAPGASGIVTFQVSIDAGLAPGSLVNTAAYEYDDGSGSTIGPVNTNPATYDVDPTAAVDLSDTGSASDEGTADDDVVEITTPVSQGSVVSFENVVVNNGNGTDTFDMTLVSNNFPVGTNFQFFQSDGAGNPTSPMTDSNGNGTPDTGPVAAGASYKVILQVTLPAGASGDNGGAGFDAVKRATSDLNPAVSDDTTDTLAEIIVSSVDLTNDSVGGPGAGEGPEPAAVTTETVDPGTTATFTLFVENTSSAPDTYDLAASTDSSFASLALPAGWTVVFKNTSGAVIADTGVLVAGASFEVTAEVSVPATAAPATTSLYFRALSSSTGALDIKHDAVTVNPVNDIALSPSNTGQVFPGGSIVYAFDLDNNGNTDETSSALTAGNSQGTWSAPVVYWDVNGDGALDGGDVVVTDISDILGANGDPNGDGILQPGESLPLLVRVEPPAGANDGDTNTTTVTATPVAGETNTTDNTVTMVTTVITSDVVLDKGQALDALCDGTADGPFSTGDITAGAIPGACIVYQITATNSGSSDVNTLVITDSTPSFTTYESCGGACVAAVTVGSISSSPADEAAGVVEATVGTVAPLNSATLTFTVQIDE